MRQAQTLNDAQLRRVIQYCRSRRHPTRDETIILTSFYAGLRAKEIAALTVGNVFDEAGNARTQFYSQQSKAKAGILARCISTSAYTKHCRNTAHQSAQPSRIMHCLRVKREAISPPTQCASCSSTSTKQLVSKMHQAIREDVLTSRAWQTRG